MPILSINATANATNAVNDNTANVNALGLATQDYARLAKLPCGHVNVNTINANTSKY